MNPCQEYLNAQAQLAHISTAITFFGSARIAPEHPDYQRTERLARRLSDEGFAIFSGGGPGIMEAANKGAWAGKSPSVGLNIVLPHEQTANPYQNISVIFQDFAPRKAMLIERAVAFIVMAGGFGTLDELFETITLIQTQKIKARPVILVGSAFWRTLVDWLREQLQARHLIGARDLDFVHVMDDEAEILAFIRQHCPLQAA